MDPDTACGKGARWRQNVRIMMSAAHAEFLRVLSTHACRHRARAHTLGTGVGGWRSRHMIQGPSTAAGTRVSPRGKAGRLARA